MTVFELIALLKQCPPDAKVLVNTSSGTLVEARRIGTVKVILTHQNPNLLPGYEWRVPLNAKDESELERETHFFVG